MVAKQGDTGSAQIPLLGFSDARWISRGKNGGILFWLADFKPSQKRMETRRGGIHWLQLGLFLPRLSRTERQTMRFSAPAIHGPRAFASSCESLLRRTLAVERGAGSQLGLVAYSTKMVQTCGLLHQNGPNLAFTPPNLWFTPPKWSKLGVYSAEMVQTQAESPQTQVSGGGLVSRLGGGSRPLHKNRLTFST